MASTDPVIAVEARELRGMVRQASQVRLPQVVARLAQDVEFRGNTVRRRKGCWKLYTAADFAVGGMVFDADLGKYGYWDNIPEFDLGYRWAVLVWGKSPATPANFGYLLSRDVTPTVAGKKTFALSMNTSRQIGVETDLASGAAADLAAGAASQVTTDKYAALLVRDATTLSLYLNGDPTPALQATGLGQIDPQVAGSEPVMLAQNYDGTTRTDPLDGTVYLVAIFRDFTTVEDLLRYTTYQKYPDPMDPRVILYSPFHDAAPTLLDYSMYQNDGTLVGAPASAADEGIQTKRGQAFFYMGDPETGELKNFALIGGTLYGQTIRRGG